MLYINIYDYKYIYDCKGNHSHTSFTIAKAITHSHTSKGENPGFLRQAGTRFKKSLTYELLPVQIFTLTCSMQSICYIKTARACCQNVVVLLCGFMEIMRGTKYL